MDYARENIARLARTVIMAALVVAGVAALAPDEAKAETTCQENNPECVYSYDEWYFFEGSGAVAANTGATATFTFEGKKGTPVTWSTVMASNAGVTDVFLDGKKVKTFDGYSPETQHGQTGYSGSVTKNTKNNIHTLKLVNTGNKNADSTQAQTFIQGFSAGGKLFLYHHSSVTYGTWQGVADKRALGGAYRVSSTPSNSDIAYTQNFSGSSYFRMITARGPSYSEHAIVIIHDAETNEVVANVNFILKNKKTRFNQAATIGTYEGKTHFAELDPEKTYYAGIYSDDGRPMVLDALVVGGHFGSSP